MRANHTVCVTVEVSDYLIAHVYNMSQNTHDYSTLVGYCVREVNIDKSNRCLLTLVIVTGLINGVPTLAQCYWCNTVSTTIVCVKSVSYGNYTEQLIS